MKIYNVITTSVCEGGAVEVSVRSTTDETKANEIFAEEKSKLEECFDEEAKQLVEAGINPLTFAGLRLSVSSEESRRINDDPMPKVILSAAGMCDAG